MQTNSYVHLTGSGQVIAGVGVLSGMYVNSTSSGTVKLIDNLTGTGTVIYNTITPVIGYHNLGNINCTTGCYASLANTLDVTFHVKQSD
jgi:hypothetical protein